MTSSEEVSKEMQMLAEDARALLNATAGMAEEKIVQARKRLAAAIENTRTVLDEAQESAFLQVKVIDQQVRDHPYQAIGIAFGVGTLLGCLLFRGRETPSQKG